VFFLKQFGCSAIALVLLSSATSARANPLKQLPEQQELFEEVLAEAGLTPEEVSVDRADMALWGGDKYRLSLLDVFFENPWKISAYARTLSDRFLAADQDLGRLAISAHKRLDAWVSLPLGGDVLAPYKQRVKALGDEALAVAIAELGDRSAIQEYEEIPPDVRTAVAQFLFAVPDILRWRQLGLVDPLERLGVEGEVAYAEVTDYVVETWEERDEEEDGNEIERVLFLESLLDAVDFHFLNAGATLSAIAAQELQRQLSALDASKLAGNYDYRIATPLGKIVLSSGGDSTYPDDDYLLIVDLAGDDTYQGGAATRRFATGLSVTLDLAGSDRYESPDDIVPSFGAGIFGYGILIDTQGSDRYSAAYLSQGVGVFGTGILYDVEGNDHYQGIGHLQGSGSFGSGLLVDNSGDDRYELYQYGQGYGFTKGFGLLLDSEGSDRYLALEDRHPNGGPFGAEHHIHFVQGAGFGRRGDFSDGHSWAGGIGFLVDGRGDDRYECEIYGMGTAYWYALGILVDKEGNDYRNGGWYSLGSSPHFGIGIHQDDGGSDRYEGILAQSLGNGRDWSIGWFEDSAGDDWYRSSQMTFGTGDVNGVGVFWDKTGDDTYLAFAEPSYGQARLESAEGLRGLMFTLGLFVDGGGRDRYLLLPEGYDPFDSTQAEITDVAGFQVHPQVGRDRVWCRDTYLNDVPGAYGCGLDSNAF